MRINQIQEQVDRGEYRVDTQAVADAIIRRLLAARDRVDAAHAADRSS